MKLYNFLKSFIQGFHSIFNINGDAFELPEIKSDSENILSDWQAIGNDIRKVVSKKELKKWRKKE